MPKPITTPDRLFDRTWRPGHPFRPRLSGRRKWGMAALFFLLCGIIAGYAFITDSNRVRAMAQPYLSQFLGGRVEIGKATLSIFEGLRLDDVKVYADDPDREATQLADGVIFSAATFLIQTSPRALLEGRVEANRIVVIDPHVTLVEDLDAHRWNYQFLRPQHHAVTNARRPGPPMLLPEVSLRNAQVDYSQVHGGQYESLGTMHIEGQLSPAPGSSPDKYVFRLQSRGKSDLLGPEVAGEFSMGSGKVTAAMYRFEFGPDIKVMLPAQVRQWWEDHGVAGPGIKVATVAYDPTEKDKPFAVNITLEGVSLTAQPQELLGRREMQTRLDTAAALRAIRGTGFTFASPAFLPPLLDPRPVTFEKVSGDFRFTKEGIDLSGLAVQIEDNTFTVNGRIDGYSPDAAATVTIASPPGQNVRIPAVPRYAAALPGNVREIYDRFHPAGTATLWFRCERPAQGGHPIVTGEINVIDGAFAFDRFPYPLRNARGRIRIDKDDAGEQELKIIQLRGKGIRGGPNEEGLVEINGRMGPFRPDIGVYVLVSGQNISNEPALMASFPEATRRALRAFDAEGKGEYPKFKGSFVCSIVRKRQEKSHWDIETDITLDDASGALVSFPYPMKGVTGHLRVLDDHVQIDHAVYKKPDGSSLELSGRVDWGKRGGGLDRDDVPATMPTTRPGGGPTLRPALTVAARNVAIDDDLLGALPADHRAWLKKIGAAGRFDLDGTITAGAGAGAKPQTTSAEKKSDLDFDFDVNLHDCTIWPVNGVPSIVSLNGALKLAPDHVVLKPLRGRRGEADVSTDGTIAWGGGGSPRAAITSSATNLKLDAPLYRILPSQAKKGWDEVQPEGTLDAKLTYNGTFGEQPPTDNPQGGQDAMASAVDAVAAPVPLGPRFELVLTPRQLAATPKVVPYRLEKLAGTVIVQPQKVVMQNVSGRHGPANVKFSGTGITTARGAWDFALFAEHLPIDDELKRAVPSPIESLLKTSEARGKIGLDFSRLSIVPSTQPGASLAPPTPPAPATNATSQPSSPMDVDFVVRVTAEDSALTAGVPMEHVNGSADLVGAVRADELTDLAGKLDVASLTLADRHVTNFRADLIKRPNEDAMQLARLQAQLADGDLAGTIEWEYPDVGNGRYALDLKLRGSDVRQLAGEKSEHDIRGQAAASLALEGTFNDPASRRGRGDVMVSGQEMYKIPIMLGLLQITNLAMPITTPFHDGTARYSVDGNRVTFENIELRDQAMLMQGSGWLDFDSKQVRMSFVTENRTWPKLPVIGDLIQSARNELLQIHVRGTIQDPKVSAAAMNTITTTVDEVFKGTPPPDSGTTKKSKK